VVVIETEGSKNLMHLNSSNLQDFIDFELDKYMIGNTRVPSKYLHGSFNIYCLDNQDNHKVPNLKYFTDYITTHGKYTKVLDSHGRSHIQLKDNFGNTLFRHSSETLK